MDTTASAAELIAPSSSPNTIAKPVTIPAGAAHGLRELSFCFQSILSIMYTFLFLKGANSEMVQGEKGKRGNLGENTNQ